MSAGSLVISHVTDVRKAGNVFILRKITIEFNTINWVRRTLKYINCTTKNLKLKLQSMINFDEQSPSIHLTMNFSIESENITEDNTRFSNVKF